MKKILSMLLVLCMAATMLAGTIVVSAEEAATPVEPLLLTGLTFDKLDDGAVVSNGGSIKADEGVYGRSFVARSIADDAGVLTAVHEGDRKYITSTRTRPGYNYDMTGQKANDLGFGTTYDLYHVTYEINVPVGDTSTSRFFQLPFGCTNLSTGRPGTYVIQVNAVGDSFSVVDATGSKILTPYFDRTAAIKNGQWQKVDIYAYMNTYKKIDVCVTVDDEVIYLANGKTEVLSMGSGIMDFYSDQQPTHLDTFRLYFEANGADLIAAKKAEVDAMLKAEADAEAEAIAKEPYVEILKFGELSANAGASSGGGVFKSTGIITSSIVQGGATDEHTAAAYSTAEDENGSYVNVTSTSYKYLVGNMRESFTKYVQKDLGSKGIYIYSVDMKVSNFNAQAYGRMSLGLDMMSASIKDKDGNTIAYNNAANGETNFTIDTNGVIEINNSVTTDHKYGIPSAPVPGAKRSETRNVAADEWFNIKFIYEITHGETQYEIKVYGVFNDDVIFTDEYTITYTDYDKDGISDDIHIGQFDFLVGRNDKTHEETVTSFRSMTFTKNNNFDWTSIDTDAWLDRAIEIEKDESGNIDVYAKKGGDGFASGVLVIAIYNANGSLKELIPSSVIADGAFSYEVPASKVVAGNIVKAFVFDSITSAVPQMKNGSLVVR
ncbi:MAG: hypothetical protein IKV86_04360 [Clostridia bacterium]|nr:hypothetical protein [Clostridia bacterium]